MKSNNRIYILFLFLFGLVLIFIYQFYYKKNLDWSKTFKDGMLQPYDFGLFKEVVIGSSQKFNEIGNGIDYFESMDEDIAQSTYVFIGSIQFLRQNELDTLMSRIRRGADAVIITEDYSYGLSNFIIDHLNLETQQSYIDDSVTIGTFYTESKLDNYICKFFDGEKYTSIVWKSFIDRSDENDSRNFYPRGKIENNVNSVKIKYGKGNLLLHCEPLLFTNYFLKESDGFVYTNEILNDIDFKHVVYDIESRNLKFERENVDRSKNANFSFILKNKSTRTAWYLFLLGLVLFVLFRLKREQRVMPVLALKRNSSLSFVNTISSLYFSRVNSSEMARIKMNLFLYFIKYQLNISTNNINADRYKYIALKAGCETKQIESIFEFYKKFIENSKAKIDSKSLINFNVSINRIYKSYYKK